MGHEQLMQGCNDRMNSVRQTMTDLISIKAKRYKATRKDRSQTISSILELSNGRPLGQSNIAQKSGTTYRRIKEYLTLLTNCDLICYNKQDLTYKTTAKGIYYLTLQRKMEELLPHIDLNLE